MTEGADTSVLYGCVLIGGQSRRMGRPKHLIPDQDGITWLELAVSRLETFVDAVVLSGAAEVPAHLSHLEKIADIAGVSGPLSGIGAALRKYPEAGWLVLACDMPEVSEKCVEWLLAQRSPETPAIIPRNPVTGRNEPLFAWYGPASRVLLEELIASSQQRISVLCTYREVFQPEIPEELCNCWQNFNSPEELGGRLL